MMDLTTQNLRACSAAVPAHRGSGLAARRQGGRAYFERYPKRKEIREMAYRGEPYWYVAQKVGCCIATVSNGIKHMLKWCVMDADKLRIARTGMRGYWSWLRSNRYQQLLPF